MTGDRRNAFSLEGEIALVTGATHGIGRACAIALGNAGAAVALGCRDIETGTALANDMQALGIRTIAVRMDMLALDSISDAVSTVEAELGPLSIPVNNAGHSRPAPALDVNAADYDSMFDLNVKGAFFASQAAARRMAPRARGAIVNIASQAGLVALDGEPIYCMTKAAMIHMTRCLAVEMGAASSASMRLRRPSRERTAPRRGSKTTRRSNRFWRESRSGKSASRKISPIPSCSSPPQPRR